MLTFFLTFSSHEIKPGSQLMSDMILISTTQSMLKIKCWVPAFTYVTFLKQTYHIAICT